MGFKVQGLGRPTITSMSGCLPIGPCVSVRVRVRVCARAHACVCACLCLSVLASASPLCLSLPRSLSLSHSLSLSLSLPPSLPLFLLEYQQADAHPPEAGEGLGFRI